MTRPSKIPFLTLAAVFVAVLVIGCPSAGGETPEATFELELSYIRDGEYDRVWTLWTPEYQKRFRDDLEVQKDAIRKYLAEGGPNVEMIGQLTASQWGLGPREVLAAPAHELAARMLEQSRDRALKKRIVGEVRIEGDRATFGVANAEDGTPSNWTLVRRDGRWLVDDTPISVSGEPLR